MSFLSSIQDVAVGAVISANKGTGSAPPTAPPPPPLPPSSSNPRVQQRQPRVPSPAPPQDSIGIGIETEFFLRPRQPAHDDTTLKLFGRKVAQLYNQSVNLRHPRMHSEIGAAYFGPKFKEWSLAYDSTIEERDSAPWGVENISPILRASPGSHWREHVRAMWEFLDKAYLVTSHESCGTHVHVSIAEGYTIGKVKRIAQAVIHFEPAFEALLPPNRLQNEYAASNWIDNPVLGRAGKSRAESIAMIEQCSTTRQVVEMMCPQQSKYWGWNFLNIVENPHYTIEFRRGPASSTVDEVFLWVELAMSFIQAAIQHGLPENFKRIPSTVGGLRWFMTNGGLNFTEGMNDHRYLNAVFENRDANSFLEPRPIGKLSPEKAQKLQKKKEEDAQVNVMLTKLKEAPYWVD